MKISTELRDEFVDKYSGDKIDREEVEHFLEPYFDFDPELARKQALTREAQKFLAAFRDDRRVRLCLGFEIDGQLAFAFVENIRGSEGLPILFAMKERLSKQIKGCRKSIDKVDAKIWLIENQPTLEEWRQERMQEPAATQEMPQASI